MDKLTIAPPISIRVTVGEAERIGCAADYYGMNKSEYIRHLIDQDYVVLKTKWAALTPLFSEQQDEASNSTSDVVTRKEGDI